MVENVHKLVADIGLRCDELLNLRMDEVKKLSEGKIIDSNFSPYPRQTLTVTGIHAGVESK